MKDLPTLLTHKLVLRPLRQEDAARLAELAASPAVVRNVCDLPQGLSEELAHRYIAEQRSEFNKGREWTWAVCLKDGLELIGCVNVVFIDEMAAELGYWLGEPYWNRGHATEAARAVIDHVFGHCTLWQFDARHLFGNAASGRVLTKLGFQLVGFVRGECHGSQQDMLQYRLLHAAWFASPERDGFV